MNQLTPSERRHFSNGIASNWETLCSSLNINPSEIKASLASTIPIDLSRQFIDVVCNRAIPIERVKAALIKSHLNLYCTYLPDTPQGPAPATSPPLGIYLITSCADGVVGTLLKQAIAARMTVYERAMRMTHGQMADVHAMCNTPIDKAAMMITFYAASGKTAEDLLHAINLAEDRELLAKLLKPADHHAVYTEQKHTANAPMATDDNPFLAVDDEERDTLGEKLRDANCDEMAQLTSALNRTGAWEPLVRKMVGKPSAATEKKVLELKTNWANGKGNPARESLALMCAAPRFANMAFEAFLIELSKSGNAEVSALATSLKNKRDGKVLSEAAQSEARINAEIALRKFFIDNNVVSIAKIDPIVAALAELGVESIGDLEHVTAEQFAQAGLTPIAAIKLKKGLVGFSE